MQEMPIFSVVAVWRKRGDFLDVCGFRAETTTMNHGNKLRKLSRTKSHRLSLLRNLVSALLHHESIRTTVPKAKEAARIAEKATSSSRSIADPRSSHSAKGAQNLPGYQPPATSWYVSSPPLTNPSQATTFLPPPSTPPSPLRLPHPTSTPPPTRPPPPPSHHTNSTPRHSRPPVPSFPKSSTPSLSVTPNDQGDTLGSKSSVDGQVTMPRMRSCLS